MLRIISIFSAVFFSCGSLSQIPPSWQPNLQIGLAERNDSLRWSPNTESDLAGYRVYFGNTSRSYLVPGIDVGLRTAFSVAAFSNTEYFQTPVYLAVTAYDQAGHESGYSNEVFYNPFADTSSTLPWPDDKSIKLLVIYDKTDTRGNPISPTIRVEWRQTSAYWPGAWAVMIQANNDYSQRGDTLVINTLHLRQYNPGYIHRWMFRARLEHAGYFSGWASPPADFQIYQATPSGIPTSINEIRIIQ